MLKNSSSSFRPLQIINEERSTHGLRYGDYTRYRKHCAHKTHRLRASLKLTHGKGREFKKLPLVTAQGSKDAHLHLLLFETERAWAHAQELSAPQDSHRSTSRYRRSLNYLSRLLTIARSPALPSQLSVQSTIELLVYALVQTARFNLRRSSASTATYYGLEHPTVDEVYKNDGSSFTHPLVQLSVAYALLDHLERAASTSKEVALAHAFKDDIGPEIRWCIHESGRGNGADDEKDSELAKHVARWRAREWDTKGIVADIAPAYADRIIKGYSELVEGLKADGAIGDSTSGKKQMLEEFVWEGQPVPVRNPELVDVLLKVQDALKKLKLDASGGETGASSGKNKGARGRIARYDGVLLSLSDAADQTRKIMEAQQVSGNSSNAASSDPGIRDINFMYAYLTYLNLTYRIERDLLILSALAPNSQKQSAKNTASTLHLLSGILQSLSQAMTLPVVDESPDLSTALSARLSHTKAQRTLHLALTYVHPTHKKYAEALLLTQRGHLHIREARSTLAILPSDSGTSPHLQFYPLDVDTLDRFEVALTEKESQFKIEWFSHNGGVVGTDHGSERHKKPLFFDIAFNYVEPPIDMLRSRAGMSPRDDISASGGKAKVEKEEVVVEKMEETPAPRGGLTGFLGSWWGRK